MSCCGECERDVARDAFDDARRADAHARRLQDKTIWSRRTARAAVFARDMIAAAQALEVAADAWEEAGNLAFAEARRERAHDNYVAAFRATHSHLPPSWERRHDPLFYPISDVEAGKLSRATGMRLPRKEKTSTVSAVRLSPWGAPVDLYRLRLLPAEQAWLRRKRPWTYALAGVR